ncbi:hypothetical protein [Streptomyces sp. NPDC002537]
MNEPAIGQCLLDYAVISEPFPLYASTDDGTTTTLHIVVSNGGGKTVYCREIVFSLPEGGLAQSLVDSDKGDGSAPGWTVEPLQQGADIALPEGDYANFVAKPTKADAAVDVSGITITLKNLHISKNPGTARIEIRETATTDTGQWPTSPGFTTLPITKFPAPEIPVQAVTDFHAEQYDAASGDAVRLTWRGPKTLAYSVVHGSGATPDSGQAEENITSFEWKGKVLRDTTFHLSYTTPDGATHVLTTTVTVKNPQLTGLTVNGDATVTGSAELGSVTVDGGATVTGSAEVGSLTVDGKLSAKSAVITDGSLTVSKGSTELRGLTVHETLTAESALTVGGLLKATKDIDVSWNGQSKFTTDGLNGLKVTGDTLKVGDNSVIRDGDSIGLQNNQKSGWLYAPAYNYDDDRGYVFRWKPGNRVGGDSWKVARD